MAKIRIGIIGCGQIAQSHMRNYAEIAGAEMVVFCDANPAAAETAAATYGGEVSTNFRDVIARDDLDAVDVCLHNNLHMPVTVAALQAGKHVYCEKPMAGSYRDAVAMQEAAVAAGKKLHIQLGLIYSNETRTAKELIEAGVLGDVYHARSAGFRRRGRPFVDGYGTPNFVQKKHASGGALYDMGVYHISQVLYLLGNPAIDRVSGKTYQRIDMDEARRQSSGYDVEEFACGFVRFADDRSMELAESWAANLDGLGGSYLLGSKAGIKLEPFGVFQNIGNISLSATADLTQANYRWTNVEGDPGKLGSSQGHWIAALSGETALLPTAEIALNTMLVSEGIYLSQALGREVTAAEVLEQSQSTAIVL